MSGAGNLSIKHPHSGSQGLCACSSSLRGATAAINSGERGRRKFDHGLHRPYLGGPDIVLILDWVIPGSLDDYAAL